MLPRLWTHPHESHRTDVGRKLSSAAVMAAGLLATALAGACSREHNCCTDVVCPLPSPLTVVVAPQSATVAVGDTIRFVALVTGIVGDPCKGDLKPTSHALTWSVGDGRVAAVVATPDSNTVTVRGLAIGSTPVIATAVADPTVKAAGLVTVK